MSRYIIKNCENLLYCTACKDYECALADEFPYKRKCADTDNCNLKQIVDLCKEQKVINCNIDGKEQVLKAYYHTHLGDKILELLNIEEVK